jgi:carboxylesterase type B
MLIAVMKRNAATFDSLNDAGRSTPILREPYGASTSGANRFMPPMKPEPRSGIRNALQHGRVCPSQDSAHFDTDGKNLANTDEDVH